VQGQLIAHYGPTPVMDRMSRHGSKITKVVMWPGFDLFARSGSMIGYEGLIEFDPQPPEVRRLASSWATGEGVPLMRVRGNGDVFLADRAADIHLIDLEPGDALSINGSNVLAFDSSLSYDIKMVGGAGMMSNAGLFNCVFSGQGRIAVTTKGSPVVLNVDQPTYVDPQAAICWSANLQTGYHRAEQLGLGTLLGRTTGERFTMSFAGQGFVIVQPSEEPPGGFLAGSGGGGQQSGQGGGLLGNLLGN